MKATAQPVTVRRATITWPGGFDANGAPVPDGPFCLDCWRPMRQVGNIPPSVSTCFNCRGYVCGCRGDHWNFGRCKVCTARLMAARAARYGHDKEQTP